MWGTITVHTYAARRGATRGRPAHAQADPLSPVGRVRRPLDSSPAAVPGVGQGLVPGGPTTAEDVAEVVAMAAVNPNLTGTVIEADGGARLVSLA
jgi:hypothetical protein